MLGQHFGNFVNIPIRHVRKILLGNNQGSFENHNRFDCAPFPSTEYRQLLITHITWAYNTSLQLNYACITTSANISALKIISSNEKLLKYIFM